MDTATPRPVSGFSPSTKWSVYAGVYALLCSVVPVLFLGRIAATIADVLSVPTGYSAFLLAGPAPFLAAAIWWAIVERRGSYTYLAGATVGLVTALFTVLFWLLWLAIVWGPLAVRVSGPVVVVALVASVPVGFAAGVPLMYARRHFDGSASGGAERAR